MPVAHAPSTVHLPDDRWACLLDALCALFPRVPRRAWQQRFAAGRVLDDRGRPLAATAACRRGQCVRYFREVETEPVIAATEHIVHADAHLVVADKPHGLPVAPTGRYVRQTLLTRLVERLGNPELVPLHRIDRATAGLVLFSARRDSRAAYQALFPQRRIDKLYEALAPPLPAAVLPYCRRSRLLRGEPFFRMREAAGAANAETRIEVIERGTPWWRYGLVPVTGRKHQLRVHMAALGAAIAGDRLYPQLRGDDDDDPTRPLQLLARALGFRDPLSGELRCFRSARTLRRGDCG